MSLLVGDVDSDSAKRSPMPKISRVKLLKKVKSNGNWILVPALFDSKGRESAPTT